MVALMKIVACIAAMYVIGHIVVLVIDTCFIDLEGYYGDKNEEEK
jgi:hypothetical protein